jgi:hypothetical protein
MGALRFGVKSAKVLYSDGKYMGGEPRLLLNLVPERSSWQTLELTTGEKKEDLDYLLTFQKLEEGRRLFRDPVREGPTEPFDEEPAEPVGTGFYFKATGEWLFDFRPPRPPNLSFQIYVEPAIVDELLKFAMGGQFPTEVTLYIPAVTSEMPDASDNKLDTVVSELFQIDGIRYSINIPVGDPAKSEFAVDTPEPDTTSETTPETMKAILAQVSETATLQRWSFWALIAIAVATVVWRR